MDHNFRIPNDGNVYSIGGVGIIMHMRFGMMLYLKPAPRCSRTRDAENLEVEEILVWIHDWLPLGLTTTSPRPVPKKKRFFASHPVIFMLDCAWNILERCVPCHAPFCSLEASNDLLA